ncbi:MAG: DUF4105 domain-containing protein [Bacteroides sp.]
MKFIPLLLFAFLLCCPNPQLAAQEGNAELPDDSIRLSLLTCAPGEEVYSLFGHTAIRYEDPSRGIDVVFNYGMFSFSTPNFMFRFTSGETDYELGVSDYRRFAGEYEYFGRNVWQQTLNLTQDEKEELIALLEANYRPENRVYRYNFLYDNCATRPRDIIEKSVLGKVVYPEDATTTAPPKTFRDMIHQFTHGHAWLQFGIDLCIGNEADRPITTRQKMFAPSYLMNSFSTAKIVKSRKEYPLVQATGKIVDCKLSGKETRTTTKTPIPTPLQAALLLFILTAGATIYGLKKKKSLWGIDLLLFGAAGIVGCVITFLVLFSQHPAVSSNYLLFIFHPAQLLCLPFIIHAAIKRKKSKYHLCNALVLTLFILLFPLMPQRFDLAVVPLALSLLTRSASHLILTYKRKK